MRLEELEHVCREAAADLVQREGRPLPAAVVLPLPEATKVTTFPDFPADDRARHELLAHFAAEVMVPASAPAYGFVAEADLDTAGSPVDVVVVVYGARRHQPQITAAPLEGRSLGEFAEPEPLDPTAMPFLQVLQHAADTAAAGQEGPGPLG